MLFLLFSSCFRCTPELLTSILAVTRVFFGSSSLSRRFRSTGMLFLLCSSCFRCTPELLTSILAVTSVLWQFFSVSEGSAVLECCSFYVLLASAALLNCSQPFQPFRECSLTVLLCERRFRSTGMLFLLCSSCFRCTPELLTTIPEVPRVFS